MSDTVQYHDLPGVGLVVEAPEYERLQLENQRLSRALNGAERCCRAIDSEQRVLVPALKKAEAERNALLKALETLIAADLGATVSETELAAHKQLVKQINRGHYRRLETLIDLGLAFTKIQSEHKECEMNKKDLPVVAKMIPAGMGKGPTFQVVNLSKEQRDKVFATMRGDEMKAAHPMEGGDQPGWISVEFWGRDAELIEKCGQSLAASINVAITPGNEFTREELGLI